MCVSGCGELGLGLYVISVSSPSVVLALANICLTNYKVIDKVQHKKFHNVVIYINSTIQAR